MSYKKNSLVSLVDLLIPLVAVLSFVVLGGDLINTGLERGLRPTLSPPSTSPEIVVVCHQGHYEYGYLVVNADEGSNAFAAYTHEGNLIKVHAMPWQFGPDHDLWLQDCVQEIAAAAQQ